MMFLHFIISFVHAVGQCGGGRFVDHPQNVQAGNLTGIFRRLTLRVVEVGRHGDDGVLGLRVQILFGRFLHFDQHEGADLTR